VIYISIRGFYSHSSPASHGERSGKAANRYLIGTERTNHARCQLRRERERDAGHILHGRVALSLQLTVRRSRWNTHRDCGSSLSLCIRAVHSRGHARHLYLQLKLVPKKRDNSPLQSYYSLLRQGHVATRTHITFVLCTHHSWPSSQTPRHRHPDIIEETWTVSKL